MKVTVAIFKDEKLVAKKTVNGHKQAEKFIKDTMPEMTIQQKVKENWAVFKSY